MAGVYVILQPVGSFSVGDAIEAARLVEEVLPVESKVRAVVWSVPAPLEAFNFSRMQYNADIVVDRLASYYRGFLMPGERLVVGLVDADGYVEGLNFVFGLAKPSLGAAAVFTRRLEINADRKLYMERLVKEVAHEVGHLLGLGHCPNRECVMSFSNSLAEVDGKRAWFCPRCRAALSTRYKIKATV